MTTNNALQEQGCKDIDVLLLKSGSHPGDFHGECCLVEYSNRLTVCKVDLREKYGAAEKFDDDHPSISRVVRAFAIGFNDGLGNDDARRTLLLKPYAAKILGTKTTAKDETTRAWMATDWLVRVHAPAFMDLTPALVEHAAKLRGLPPLTSAKIARQTQQVIDEARTASNAAGDAARAAAGDAARAAACSAAGDAAGAAACSAAWDAARAAACSAAWDAAWDAARDAARDAAWAALRPTVEALQLSACDLLDRLILVGASPSQPPSPT
jgi:hypothetical protein